MTRQPDVPDDEAPTVTADPAADEASRSHDTFPERAIPNDAYFVLGDLRNNSSDSRTWGPVPAALVRGRAILTF